MRRIAVGLMSTISALVLLFSYHTSTGQSSSAGPLAGGDGAGTGSRPRSGPAADGTSGTGSAASGSGAGAGNGPTASDSGTSAGSGSSSGGQTVTGDVVQTRWGPVQVQITVQGGKIAASDAVVVPNENSRDQRINSYAVPILNQQAVQAQSSRIDGVSGATVTSTGYQESLQSAIDKAHLG